MRSAHSSTLARPTSRSPRRSPPRRGILRLVTGNVRLMPVDGQAREPLLCVAVTEAEPDEVMPPVEAPAGWSHERQEAFRRFHRSNYGGLDGPGHTGSYAIVFEGDGLCMSR